MVLPATSVEGSFLGGKVSYMINATETASHAQRQTARRDPHHPRSLDHRASKLQLRPASSPVPAASTPGSSPTSRHGRSSSPPSQGSSGATTPGATCRATTTKCIAIPATSPDVIAVAGYATRNTLDNRGASAWTLQRPELGDILTSRAPVPSADPAATGQKPEITAPGGMIASTLSSSAAPASAARDGRRQTRAAGRHQHVSSICRWHDRAHVRGRTRISRQDDVKSFIIKSAYVGRLGGRACPTTAGDTESWTSSKRWRWRQAARPQAQFVASGLGPHRPPAEDGKSGCSMIELASSDAQLYRDSSSRGSVWQLAALAKARWPRGRETT